METVEDDDAVVPKNIAPRKKNCVLELSDGSDDDDIPIVPAKKVVIFFQMKN
jgi:hypothetical protein